MSENLTPGDAAGNRSNVIPLFRDGQPPRPRQVSPGGPSAGARACAKRELLARGQYAAARVLARIIAGGYGGTFRSNAGGKCSGCHLTVADGERARLRERVISLAARLGLDPESFIYYDRARTQEWPVWPHKVFVASVKLLERRRREGRPDEAAERIVRELSAYTEDHRAACRTYKSEPECDRGTPEPRRNIDRLAALRRMLARLKEQGDITDSSAIFRLETEIDRLGRAVPDDEWPEYIPG